ncbi:hypothetical protein RMSM_03406 [Rhodopirellula maiorica SM1]|uniref:Uncharacterized protein n=1 Tax=Rhodopirellula maiorica SM1 TaxID=1265738 RepID=M5RW92_9BACT|nr:hypothetical protein RMSM_03406 [Rhodopirellula maiorica SM1]
MPERTHSSTVGVDSCIPGDEPLIELARHSFRIRILLFIDSVALSKFAL